MLTFSIGYAGPPWTGVAMARHLSLPTVTRHIEADLERCGIEPVATAIATLPAIASDLHPDLARLLGIAPGLTDIREISALLSGHSADGRPIPGAVRRKTARSLAEACGITEGRLPRGREIEAMASVAAGDSTDRAVGSARRALALWGVEPDQGLSSREISNMAEGRRPDGSELCSRTLIAALRRSASRISYVDFCFSADKSVSLAFALTAGAERAMVAAAHRDAADETARDLVKLVGFARKGNGGRLGGREGQCAMLTFPHYTARPTGVDRRGRIAETGRRFGDPQIHSHHLILNAVVLPDGAVGSLYLGALRHKVFEYGALYQARLAANLRRAGIDVVYDRERRCARISTVDDELLDAFSRRTTSGRQRAATYAATLGLDLGGLSVPHRTKLIKRGVQAPHGARGDDVADEEAWRATAAAIGRLPAIVTRPARRDAECKRIESAVAVALQARADAIADEKPISDVTAALRGLVAAGFEGPDDVDAVVRAMATVAAVRGQTSDAARRSPEPRRPSLGDRRARGSAILIEGTAAEYIESVAERWCERWSGKLAAPEIVGCADADEARRVSEAIRARRRAAGEIGDDIVDVAIGGGGTLTLARGDVVALTAPVNASGLGERKRRGGRIGVAGSRLRIESIEPGGIIVQNHKGRRAVISWRDGLYDDQGGGMRVACGYTTTAVDGRETMMSFLRGVRDEAREAGPRTALCFSAEVEGAGVAERRTPEQTWERIERKLDSGDRSKVGSLLQEVRSCRLATQALTRRLTLAEERQTPTTPAHLVVSRLARLSIIAARIGSLANGCERLTVLAKSIVASRPQEPLHIPHDAPVAGIGTWSSGKPIAGAQERLEAIRSARLEVEQTMVALDRQSRKKPAGPIQRSRRALIHRTLERMAHLIKAAAALAGGFGSMAASGVRSRATRSAGAPARTKPLSPEIPSTRKEFRHVATLVREGEVAGAMDRPPQRRGAAVQVPAAVPDTRPDDGRDAHTRDQARADGPPALGLARGRVQPSAAVKVDTSRGVESKREDVIATGAKARPPARQADDGGRGLQPVSDLEERVSEKVKASPPAGAAPVSQTVATPPAPVTPRSRGKAPKRKARRRGGREL